MRGVGNCWRFAISSSPMMRRPRKRAPVTLDQESVGRLSRIDAMQVQAMALAAQRHRQAECSRIDAALMRIDSGDYGWCVRCGEEIEAKRLDRAPATTMCLACAKEG
ncbi:TraR/DksA family transcriptional regulator [Rhizorhabdus dicambivorans]